MSLAWTRRQFLASGAVLPAGPALAPAIQPASSPRRSNPSSLHVIVVGAGAFGGWTAFHLQRLGARVTLIDAWGPGNSRSSSGGDTRVIRAVYGPDRIYHQMVARSLQIWKDVQERWQRALYRPIGALWMFASDDSYVCSSLPHARQAGFQVDELSLQKAAQRFPQVDFEGIQTVFYEEEAGYLLARQACQAVWERFTAQGGEFRQGLARPGKIHDGQLGEVKLEGGRPLRADAFVFACGPWLGRLFPDVLGERIRPTRQPVFYFGTPPGDPSYCEQQFPVWIEFGPRVFYGIPGAEGRGFKWADDTRGPDFDPDQGERLVTLEEIRSARRHLARRFPGLAGAPLLESRVCQYENSPDGHFILDRHPEAENLWLAGGGSGHGFKLGPAVGEHMALRVLGRAEAEPFFSLSRLQGLEGSPATQIGVRKKP
ncbi:MAG: FAD-dependent oxidoreductase [Acidobacteriota bacterium]